MSIFYRGSGTAAGGSSATTNTTASATPGLPTGLAPSERAFILCVGSGTIAAPASWSTALAAVALGSGTAGDTTGTRFLAAFYRDYDGVWTMPSVTTAAVTAVAPGIECVSHGFGKMSWDTFNTPTVGSGSDTTSGTGYSVATGAINVSAGDQMIAFFGWPISPGTLSAFTLGLTGVTAGSTGNNHGLVGQTTGSDVFIWDAVGPITATTTSPVSVATPTLGITGTVAGTAGGVFIFQGAHSVPPSRVGRVARMRASNW